MTITKAHACAKHSIDSYKIFKLSAHTGHGYYTVTKCKQSLPRKKFHLLNYSNTFTTDADARKEKKKRITTKCSNGASAQQHKPDGTHM